MTGRPPRWLVAAVVVLAATAVAALAVPSLRPAVRVVVDGRAVEVAGSRPTVRAALLAAGRAARDGVLRSAGTGTVLDAHASPATVTVDGAPATVGHRLREGARVAVADGVDATEPTEVKQVAVAPPPGPDVETRLWYPGAPGVDEVVAGTVSGEVVTRRRVSEPVPPRREEGRVVALTFDDGPSPTYTPPVLQVLADEGVPATFCLVGDMVRKRPELTRTVVGNGHTVCSHTMNHHDRLDERPPVEVEREVATGADIVATTTGTPVSLFRAPGGRTTPAMLDLVRRRGMRVVGWTLDARDFYDPDPHVHAQRIINALEAGSVLLLHDGGGDRATTVALLRPMVQALKALGWQFATPLSPPPPPPPPAEPPPPPAPTP